jgi:hypothetical protein
LLSLSYDDEIDYVVNSNISLLMIGFVLLFVYVALVLGNLNLVEQRVRTVESSAPDPDPDPPDPHVFGPPGSFYQQANIVTCFGLFIFGNDVNVYIYIIYSR